MKMLTSEGKIVEGTPVTDEDVAVRNDLTKRIKSELSCYENEARRAADVVIRNYSIKPRNSPLETVYDGPTADRSEEE